MQYTYRRWKLAITLQIGSVVMLALDLLNSLVCIDLSVLGFQLEKQNNCCRQWAVVCCILILGGFMCKIVTCTMMIYYFG